MRALQTLALALVMATAFADASLVLHRHPVVAERMRKHANGDSVSFTGSKRTSPVRSGNHTDAWSNTYRLVLDFGVAIVTQNWTWADSLLDDNAIIFASAAGCGDMNKTEYLAAIQAAPVLARYFDIGAWAGYAGDADVLHATVAAVLGDGSDMPNATVHDDKTLFYAQANEAGTQLLVWEHINAQMQANSTAMVDAFHALRDATALRDIAPWEAALSSEYEWAMYTAWNPEATIANRSTFLANMQDGWSHEAVTKVHEYYAYSFCNFVVADLLWSGIYTDGSAQIQRFTTSMQFNPDLSVNTFVEYTQMPWL